MRLQPFAGLIADLQGGLAYNFLNVPGKSRTRGDVRAIASYGYGLFPELGSPDRLTLPIKPFANAFLSAGYYSRYENSINYALLRAGLRVAEWKYIALDIYVRGNMVVDAKRDFYNNVAEGSFGIRPMPYFPWGLNILGEFHRGLYWDSGSVGIPGNRYYNTFRLFLVIDQALCF
jgi:hypothetical protein